MAESDTQIRIQRATNDALKSVCKKLTQFSTAGLANSLLMEACEAALGTGPSELPTLKYLLSKLAKKTEEPPAAVPVRYSAAEQIPTASLNEPPPNEGKQQRG